MTRGGNQRPPTFHFEGGTVRLLTGEVFKPARNAVDRWVLASRASYAVVGMHYQCLYQTADNRFVYVHAVVSPPQWGSTEEVEEARLVPEDEARAFLLENNFDLPDCLSEGLAGFPDAPKPALIEDDAEDDDIAESATDGGPPQTVTIANWHEGGKAFAEAFMGAGAGNAAELVKPAAIADRLEQLIRDAEYWMEQRPRAYRLDKPYPEHYRKEDEQIEQTRQKIAAAGDALKLALVKHGESAGPLLSLLNWIADKDTTAARKEWPVVKVSLQEAAIRLRMHDEDDAAVSPSASSPDPPMGTDETDNETQTPALTRSDRLTLCALATFDSSFLASSVNVAEAIPPADRISDRTVRESIKKLVGLRLAERPEGDKQGTRLTLRGRRLATKLAE